MDRPVGITPEAAISMPLFGCPFEWVEYGAVAPGNEEEVLTAKPLIKTIKADMETNSRRDKRSREAPKPSGWDESREGLNPMGAAEREQRKCAGKESYARPGHAEAGR